MDANIVLGHLNFNGLLPGVESIGPVGELKPTVAKDFFDRAKALDVNGAWEGPPKEFVEAQRELQRVKEREIVVRKEEKEKMEKGEESAEARSIGDVLWDNSLYISASAVVVAFAYHFYRKSQQ